MTPRQRLTGMLQGFRATQLIHVAAELGIADLLTDGPRTADELAGQVDADPRALYRVMRALTNFEVFVQDGEGRFALAPLGELLRSEVPGSMRSRASKAGQAMTWRPWGELLYSVKTGNPAFDHVYGMSQDRYLAEHPQSSQNYDDAMASVTGRMAAAFNAKYDLSKMEIVVDVGGGNGTLLATILRHNPRMRGILGDLPHVLEGAPAVLDAAGVADRAEVMPLDFFREVPKGGDAYILKWILHGWDDAKSVEILRTCRKAMSGNARLVIIEVVIPTGDDPYQTRLRDIHMMINGGKERTEAEFRALLEAGGFALTKHIATDSPFSILEAAPA